MGGEKGLIFTAFKLYSEPWITAWVATCTAIQQKGLNYKSDRSRMALIAYKFTQYSSQAITIKNSLNSFCQSRSQQPEGTKYSCVRGKTQVHKTLSVVFTAQQMRLKHLTQSLSSKLLHARTEPTVPRRSWNRLCQTAISIHNFKSNSNAKMRKVSDDVPLLERVEYAIQNNS